VAKISKKQLVALQTMYGQYERRSLDVAGEEKRATRLEFARSVVGRQIESFNDLTDREARQLLQVLARALGKPDRPRGMSDRDRAHDAGTHGRRGYDRSRDSLVSAADLARIDDAISRLRWDRKRLDGWLRSSSSPLRGRVEIRTLADANRVWWPLVKMLRRAGAWRADDEAGFVAPAPPPAGPASAQRSAEEKRPLREIQQEAFEREWEMRDAFLRAACYDEEAIQRDRLDTLHKYGLPHAGPAGATQEEI
jgi:hypothetical protein